MAEHHLSLAVNGRENQLRTRLVTFETAGHAITTGSVAIVGLGYVGLPTAVELHGKSPRIIGIDVSEQRLRDIAAREADLTEADQERLAAALADGCLELTTDPAAAAAAETVIICVPTPVDTAPGPGPGRAAGRLRDRGAARRARPDDHPDLDQLRRHHP